MERIGHTILGSIRKIILKVWRHPANSQNRVGALFRAIVLQIRLRVGQKAVVYPWVGGLRLSLKRGYHSLTAQVYFQYSEYNEMHFLLDHLKKGDLFVDVGANMGAYSLLAAGVKEARVIALEPLPDNVEVLHEQLMLNGLTEKVQVLPIAAGEQPDTLQLVTKSSQNTFIIKSDDWRSQNSLSVEVRRLDAILPDCPRIIKIDVEGHELFVLKGLGHFIQDPHLQYIICEMVHPAFFEPISNLMAAAGFAPYVYDVQEKMLKSTAIGFVDNVIWGRRG